MKNGKGLPRMLRAVIILAAALAIFAAALLVPAIAADMESTYPEYAYMTLPCEIFLWVSAALFLWALVIAWVIAGNIAAGESFTLKNADLLRQISYLAFAECILYAAFAVVLFCLGLLHPSILLLGVVMCSIGVCAAVVCAALSRLTEKAAQIREENELTI